MTDRVELQYMVDPKELARLAYVPNPMRIVVTKPESIFFLGVLGESGRKLVKAGIPFYFERKLAEGLIKMGVAEEIKE